MSRDEFLEMKAKMRNGELVVTAKSASRFIADEDEVVDITDWLLRLDDRLRAIEMASRRVG